MASGWYSKALRKIGRAQIDLQDAAMKVLLVDTGAYTVDLAAHEFLSDVPVGARVAATPAVNHSVADGGIFDADDTTWSDVTGPTVEAVLFYLDTGDPATSPLILYADNSADFPIPATSGQDVIVRWSNGANKIGRL